MEYYTIMERKELCYIKHQGSKSKILLSKIKLCNLKNGKIIKGDGIQSKGYIWGN